MYSLAWDRSLVARVGLVIAALGLCGGAVRAAMVGQVLDQSFDPGAPTHFDSVIYNNLLYGGFAADAQTFTVGGNGLLSEVDVKVAGLAHGATPFDKGLKLQLLKTTDGTPRSDPAGVLAEIEIPAAFIPKVASISASESGGTFLPVSLSGNPPIAVHAGDVLAIALSVEPGDSYYVWPGRDTNPVPAYAGGRIFTRQFDGPGFVWNRPALFPNAAQSFTTYITVPEPSSLWLLALSALTLRRRTGDAG